MIYLAGSCAQEHRKMMETIANFLRINNEEIYCPFEFQINNAYDYSQEEWARCIFEADKAAIDKADIFLMISPGRIGSAGTNWEQGYAYAKNKKVIVIQYTNEPTSLMTFCGCDIFINTSCLDDILLVIHENRSQEKCPTILT